MGWVPEQGGYAVAQLVEALRYKSEGRGFDSRWCHWNFSLTQSFWPHYGPGVDSASNRNEYQEYFLRGKSGRCIGLTTLPPYVPIVLKSGSLNILEPSGPVQACNGIAFLLYLNRVLTVISFSTIVFVFGKVKDPLSRKLVEGS